MRVELRRVELPDVGLPDEPPSLPQAAYETRARAIYAAAATDWVAVYGDREHNANLLFLTGFDPRFEEALLLLGPADRRLLLVGNEGVVHASIAALPVEVILYQGFSLMGQPRDTAPRLHDVLRAAGLAAGRSVGVAGWKYLESSETDHPSAPAFVPAFLVDTLRQITGADPIDITPELMHPVRGLRAHNTAAQIAVFEWAAVRASNAIFRVVRGLRPGMTERDAASLLAYAGEPLSMHPIVASASPGHAINGLRSPTGRPIAPGDGVTTGIGYWGSLCCRAGLLLETPDDSFLANVVRPYFAAIATWYTALRIGVDGGEIHAAVHAALEEAGAAFLPMLNPGHLISYDEWLHSPIRPGSPEPIVSGMLLQCDIIPTPLPPGTALNCEDTIAIAGESLRAELARDHPDLWRRIQTRRAFMEAELGLTLSPDLLPLSSANAYLPPFWLDNSLVCAVSP
jgi:Xaa-Pro aminopeptidase